MFDSDSDHEEFLPAVLQRPKVANYITHESFTVDTRDHEDHTFCGMMFDIQCLGPEETASPVPLEFLQVDAVSVRGDLGSLTVWSRRGPYSGKEHRQDEWELLYEGDHAPSRLDYQKLELATPLRLFPGEVCGFYVHSKLRGDDAIVYDNQRSRVTYEDHVFRVLPGLAHLSNKPFGRHGMWGFPWRERREFVGRFYYGVGYKLWNPEVHSIFPSDFQQIVKDFLMCANRQDSPVHCLQDEVLFYILNMCRYDWFRREDEPVQREERAPRSPRVLEEMYGLYDRAEGHSTHHHWALSDDRGSLGSPDTDSDEDFSSSDVEISDVGGVEVVSDGGHSMSDIASGPFQQMEEPLFGR